MVVELPSSQTPLNSNSVGSFELGQGPVVLVGCVEGHNSRCGEDLSITTIPFGVWQSHNSSTSYFLDGINFNLVRHKKEIISGHFIWEHSLIPSILEPKMLSRNFSSIDLGSIRHRGSIVILDEEDLAFVPLLFQTSTLCSVAVIDSFSNDPLLRVGWRRWSLDGLWTK